MGEQRPGIKSDEEIQEEIDNPHTKGLIVMPAAKDAYLVEQNTFNFPMEIESVINEGKTITLESYGNMLIKQMMGMMCFVADDNPEKSGEIDNFVDMLREAEGEGLDHLAPERIQMHFGVGEFA